MAKNTAQMKQKVAIIALLALQARQCFSFCPVARRDPALSSHSVSDMIVFDRKHRQFHVSRNKSFRVKASNHDHGFSRTVETSVGLIAQPVVWTSLYFVATTGAGLPPGPLGLLGATEGVSYLVILALVIRSLSRGWLEGSPDKVVSEAETLSERLSVLSLVSGLFVLATLVAKQGCVPNAKPILDYSDYLPICEATPGLFGN